MSLYIPNVKLPLDGKLRITVYPNGRAYISTDDGVTCTTPSAIVDAIEVPEHGRLVDADVLETQLVIDFDIDDHILIADDLYAAPTIIPADEGGDAK